MSCGGLLARLRHRRDSSPSEKALAGFWCDFGPIRAKATGRCIHHGVHLSHVVRAEVHAPRSLEHVAELEAGLADRGRVDERCEFSDVSDHNSVEQRLVAIMELREVHVFLDVIFEGS